MRQVLHPHVLHEFLQVRRGRALFVLSAPVLEIHPRIRQQHPLGAQQTADAQIQPRLLVQPGALGGDLIQQHAADGTGSDEADGDRVGRQIQPGVHGSQRTSGMPPFNDHRDVPL